MKAGCSLLSTLLGWGLSGGLGGLGGLLSESHLGVLVRNSLLLTDGVLSSSGFSLSLEVLLADNFSLGLVDSFDENVLVLELVTLGSKIEFMVHLAVNFLLVSISLEKTTENTKTAHPDDLLGHTGVFGTLSLTGTLMTTLALGLGPLLAAGARVSRNILSHDKFVLDKLSNVLAYTMKRIIIKFCNQREKLKPHRAAHLQRWLGKRAFGVCYGGELVSSRMANNDLRELANATSLVSLGSIHTRFLPHFRTAAASLFCNLKNAIIYIL